MAKLGVKEKEELLKRNIAIRAYRDVMIDSIFYKEKKLNKMQIYDLIAKKYKLRRRMVQNICR